MRLDKTNFGIFIVTYNRQLALNKTVRQYLETIPFCPSITIISNHTDCTIDDDLKPYVQVIFNALRPNESWGYLARNWNQCFILGLKEFEWILCSQDDVISMKGWFEIVNETNYDFYLAPLGDTRFLLNRQAFRSVGWFDERFSGIGYQDYDYIQRVLALIPDSASVIDFWGDVMTHQRIRHNSVGLENYWLQPEPEGFDRSAQRTGVRHPYLVKYFVDKWGFYPDTKLIGIHPDRLPEEIDWYPFVSGRYEYLQIDNPQYPEVGDDRIDPITAIHAFRVPRTRYLGLMEVPEDSFTEKTRIISFLEHINRNRQDFLGLIVLYDRPDDEIESLDSRSGYLTIVNKDVQIWKRVLPGYMDLELSAESEEEYNHQDTRMISIGEIVAMAPWEIENLILSQSEGDGPKSYRFTKSILHQFSVQTLCTEVMARVRRRLRRMVNDAINRGK